MIPSYIALVQFQIEARDLAGCLDCCNDAATLYIKKLKLFGKLKGIGKLVRCSTIFARETTFETSYLLCCAPDPV